MTMSTVTSPDSPGPHVLALDCLAEADRIGQWRMVETLAHRLRRRGSRRCDVGRHRQFRLCRARGAGVGADKVFGLLLPERDSSARAAPSVAGFLPSISEYATKSSISRPHSRPRVLSAAR